MEIDDLKEYYNKIDACSVSLSTELDFDYLQEKIVKTALITESLNRIIGEILIEQTRIDHLITDKKFSYELRFTQFQMNNVEVKSLSTSKERKDYINYFLMKDEYRSLLDLEQEGKDIEKLLDLAKKKARDLDRIYPKLKTMWESYSSEMRNIKKIGSDSEHINRVRDKITEENKLSTPVFTDTIVEELESYQYINNKDNLSKFSDIDGLKETEHQINQESAIDIVDELLRDL